MNRITSLFDHMSDSVTEQILFSYDIMWKATVLGDLPLSICDNGAFIFGKTSDKPKYDHFTE